MVEKNDLRKNVKIACAQIIGLYYEKEINFLFEIFYDLQSKPSFSYGWFLRSL